ncbi:piriformospora indica-insensitive protein 2-like [Vicia villosa]|uniref:piriformospora indica-insensitive protein 2-like n=1 Tax=Vicia villosa TaxID=3911 RepID=UPI00273CE6DB|nr:piriformospora indica-insensitive protein 2-like [Vicia villosa]
MVLFSTFSQTLLYMFIFFLFISLSFSQEQPPIDPLEQKALYDVLNSLNPTIPWTTDYPDDFCLSAPHGVVCDYYSSDDVQNQQQKAHIVELNFGYVSDETPNPPCSPNATLNPLLFTSFPYLQKLFFYKCFNYTQYPLHLTSLPSLPPSLQELVFIQNPSLVSPLQPFLHNLTSLRRLVFIGNAFHGELPLNIGDYTNLEELTLSTNNLSGMIPASLGRLKKLKILDLSQNKFKGCVPEEIANLTSLLKLDLSYNGFECKIPESFTHLKNMKFLDLSFNLFGNFGVPLFLGEIPSLKEVYLSGNLLSGKIPEIWGKLGGVEKIGFSEMGLVGEIPVSMGIYLKNLSYLGLDNNKLDGSVPEEFGLLEFANEINLENNNLSGRISLPSRVEQKLKLAGNIGLCLGNNASCSSQIGESLGQINPYKIEDILHDHDDVLFNGNSLLHFDPLMLVLVLVGWLLCFTLDG